MVSGGKVEEEEEETMNVVCLVSVQVLKLRAACQNIYFSLLYLTWGAAEC